MGDVFEHAWQEGAVETMSTIPKTLELCLRDAVITVSSIPCTGVWPCLSLSRTSLLRKDSGRHGYQNNRGYCR
jgi:hypothetical protein